MVETEGVEKHSDQIITDFLYIIEVPIPRGLINSTTIYKYKG